MRAMTNPHRPAASCKEVGEGSTLRLRLMFSSAAYDQNGRWGWDVHVRLTLWNMTSQLRSENCVEAAAAHGRTRY